jgi:hypothetical protein
MESADYERRSQELWASIDDYGEEELVGDLELHPGLILMPNVARERQISASTPLSRTSSKKRPLPASRPAT